MHQKTMVLFLALVLILAGCQSSKPATDTPYPTTNGGDEQQSNSLAYPANGATNEQLATEPEISPVAETPSPLDNNNTNPYPMGNVNSTGNNPYPTGSDNSSPDQSENGLNSSFVFKTSEPNTATLHGVLLVMDPMLALPDANDGLFLVPLPANDGFVTIPPFTVGEVPQAEVDEITGEFVFTNIKPGRYVIVVLTSGGAHIPAKFYGQGGFAITEVKESDLDKTVELDYLQL